MVSEELWMNADLLALETVWKHPKVYPWLGDDFIPDAEQVDFHPYLKDRTVRTFVCHASHMPVGVIAYRQRNSLWWQIHLGFVPGFRGALAARFVRRTLQIMFKEAGAVKITAELATNNKAALHGAALIGFKREGIIRKSIMHQGQLRDQILLGICRDEWRF